MTSLKFSTQRNRIPLHNTVDEGDFRRSTVLRRLLEHRVYTASLYMIVKISKSFFFGNTVLTPDVNNHVFSALLTVNLSKVPPLRREVILFMIYYHKYSNRLIMRGMIITNNTCQTFNETENLRQFHIQFT